MTISIISKRSSADGALQYFNRYKDGFGEVLSAKMIGDQQNVTYELILKNDKQEELVIKDCCSSGYWGGGPSATYEILTSCGFEIEKEFIEEHINFEISK